MALRAEIANLGRDIEGHKRALEALVVKAADLPGPLGEALSGSPRDGRRAPAPG